MIRLQIYFNCFSLGVNYDSKFVVIHSFSVFGEKRNGEIAIPWCLRIRGCNKNEKLALLEMKS